MSWYIISFKRKRKNMYFTDKIVDTEAFILLLLGLFLLPIVVGSW
jgi:hypothetical protein